MSNPKLLLCDTLPLPLDGKTPSKIKGRKWWDTERKKAYVKYDNCCHGCGINKSHTYKKRIEGHEIYSVDYDTCTVELKEVVALCRRCHNFIHIGRLMAQYTQGQVGRRYIQIVVNHGVEVLTKAGLKPLARQGLIWLQFEKGYSEYDAKEYVIRQDMMVDKFHPNTWDDWSIIIDGKEYKGMTRDDWEITEYEDNCD